MTHTCRPTHSFSFLTISFFRNYTSLARSPKSKFLVTIVAVFHTDLIGLDWIEQGLTSPPTQYRLSGRQFYRSKDPTNSIKVLKEKTTDLMSC